MAFYPEGLQQQTDLNTSTLQDSGYFNITPVRVKYTFLNLEQIKKDNRKLYDKYQGDNPGRNRNTRRPGYPRNSR